MQINITKNKIKYINKKKLCLTEFFKHLPFPTNNNTKKRKTVNILVTVNGVEKYKNTYTHIFMAFCGCNLSFFYKTQRCCCLLGFKVSIKIFLLQRWEMRCAKKQNRTNIIYDLIYGIWKSKSFFPSNQNPLLLLLMLHPIYSILIPEHLRIEKSINNS